MQVRVPAVFVRGGTSRAVVFSERELKGYTPAQVDAIALAAIGSPDPYGRELDGLGGGYSSVSKVAVVGRAPEGSGADVTFRFGQVDVYEPRIDWVGNCGNISAAIGPYAIDEGLVPVRGPVTPVTVLSLNTGQRYVAHVPTADGVAEPEGDYELDGVPGTAAPIELEFLSPGGSQGQGLLPTGLARDVLRPRDGRAIEVSIVDASNPMVFVRAADLGATGLELPDQVEATRGVFEALEELRDLAAVAMGLAETPEAAHADAAMVPKIAMLASPADYTSTRGQQVAADAYDLAARAVSMNRVHKSIPLTGALCLAVACGVEGTLAAELCRPSARERGRARLGHPAGVLEIGFKVDRRADGVWEAVSVSSFRTARRIMEGRVCVPSRYLRGEAWFQRRPALAGA